MPANLRLYTVKEAAGLLRISKAGLYQMIRQKAIPAVHLGRAVRIRETDLFQILGVPSPQSGSQMRA